MESYFPDETLRGVFAESDIEEVNRLCRVNHRFASICRDDSLWKEKALRDFGPGVKKADSDTWKQTYRLLHVIRSVPMHEWIDSLYAIEQEDMKHADPDRGVHCVDFDLGDYCYLFSSDGVMRDPHSTIVHHIIFDSEVLNAASALVSLRDQVEEHAEYANTVLANSEYKKMCDQIMPHIDALKHAGL